MTPENSPSRMGRGLLYFCVGLAIGGVFYLIITSGWRGSVKESQLLVQLQWAINEREWLAVDEIGRRLVRRDARSPEGWEAIIKAALGRGRADEARELLAWVQEGMPAHMQRWEKFSDVLDGGEWVPEEPVPTEELPTLGEPLVRVKAHLTNRPFDGCVTLTFDHAIYSFLVTRAGSYTNESTGRSVWARLPEPDPNPEVEKFEITFCPVQPLERGDVYRFVFNLSQERFGGAWFAYPAVLEIPAAVNR